VVGEIEIVQEARMQPYQRNIGSNLARDRTPFGPLYYSTVVSPLGFEAPIAR
jgi:hypothetical protein